MTHFAFPHLYGYSLKIMDESKFKKDYDNQATSDDRFVLQQPSRDTLIFGPACQFLWFCITCLESNCCFWWCGVGSFPGVVSMDFDMDESPLHSNRISIQSCHDCVHRAENYTNLIITCNMLLSTFCFASVRSVHSLSYVTTDLANEIKLIIITGAIWKYFLIIMFMVNILGFILYSTGARILAAFPMAFLARLIAIICI